VHGREITARQGNITKICGLRPQSENASLKVAGRGGCRSSRVVGRGLWVRRSWV